MMASKKKRGKGKEKKVRKKCLNERETLSYEQEILDNNRQLSRLRSHNEELENQVKNITKQFEQLKEDRSDIVAYLKQNLEEKIGEAQELNERLLALEELRKQEQAEYKKKESAMELEYRNMENNLSAEVKLAAGKLNALEDWRLARLNLMHKFEIQEEQIAKQEELHKKTLYETEKSVIIAKAKMQSEMEERLKQLAQEFNKVTNTRIADVMNRAIRSNITLNHELNSMLKLCQDWEMKSIECKDNDRMLKLQCNLLETEAEITLNNMIKQRNIMEQIAKEHVIVILKYGKLQRQHTRFQNYEKLIDECKVVCTESQEEVKILEKCLQETRKAKQDIVNEVRSKCKELDKLNKILNEAKQCVLEALQLQEHVCMDDVCTSCCADQKQKIIYTIQNILEEYSIPDIIEGSDS